MHDAIVTGMLCTRRHDSITQGKIGGADRRSPLGRASAAVSHLWTRRDPPV